MIQRRDICETCKYWDRFGVSDVGACKNVDNVVGDLINDIEPNVIPEGVDTEGTCFKGCFGCIFHERKVAKKIIFLDRDGVLVTNGYQGKAVALLNKLTNETGASIVISASMRSKGLTECRKELMDNGVTGDIIDTTPLRGHNDVRGAEIESYINGKGFYYPIKDWDALAWEEGRTRCIIESYVILDDDGDFFIRQKDHYVQMDGQKGFIEDHQFERAVQILNTDFRK